MNIIVYTKTGCPWCKGVTDFLSDRDVEFEERVVTGNQKNLDEMRAKSGQEKAPTLDIDGYILADSDKDQVEAYLKEKGVI